MSKLTLKHEVLRFWLQVFQWKIRDTFYIEKWSAKEHTYLGFTWLLGHLERQWEQFCNLGSVSDTMYKKYTNKIYFWFSICTTYNNYIGFYRNNYTNCTTIPIFCNLVVFGIGTKTLNILLSAVTGRCHSTGISIIQGLAITTNESPKGSASPFNPLQWLCHKLRSVSCSGPL